MMEPVAKLTEKNIETIERMDTAQLEVPMIASSLLEIFSPERGAKGDAG